MGTEDKQTTRGTGRGDEDEDQLIIIPLANGRSLMAGPPSAREVRPPLLVVSTGRGVCGGVRGHSGWGAGKGTARAFSFVFRPIALAACQRLENQGQLVASPATPSPGVGVPGVGLTFAGVQWPRGGGGGAEEQRGGREARGRPRAVKEKKELTAQTRLIRESRTKSWQHFHVAITNESGSHQHTTLFTLTFSSQTI